MIPTDSANMADPTEAQEEIPNNTKGVLTEQKKEEIKGRTAFLDAIHVATSTSEAQSKTGIVAAQDPSWTWTLPSKNPQRVHAATSPRELAKGRDVLTLQEQEFWTRFTDLGASDLLAAFDVPEQQPLKKLATLVLADGSGDEAPASNVHKVTRKQRSVTPVATGDPSKHASMAYRGKPRAQVSNGKQSSASDLDKIKESALASTSKPSLGSSGALASTVAPAREDKGLDSMFDVSFLHSGRLISTSSFLALTASALASPTLASLGSSDDLVVASARAIKNAKLPWPPIVRTYSPRSHAPLPSPKRKDTAIASTSNVSSGLSGAHPPTSSFALLLGARPPTSPLALEGAAPDTLLPASVNGIPPAFPLALDGAGSSPSSATNLKQSGSLTSTLSPASASPLDVDSGEPSPTVTEPGTFRLFDLPQELQDAIFEFAYTERRYKNVYKRDWDIHQTHLRKTTDKPRVDFPPHKVNEWMVSKRYFRAAARAWIGAQTCKEVIKERVNKPTYSDNRFPTLSHALVDGGLFLEFARALIFYLREPICRSDSQQISHCRRLRRLAFVIDEDFFVETDRGFAWEVKFTRGEILDSLRRANFRLPPGNVLTYWAHNKEVYANTPARLKTYNSNLKRLKRIVDRLERPTPDTLTSIDYDALYIGSKVPRGARWENPDPPKQVLRSKEYSEIVRGKQRQIARLQQEVLEGLGPA
jgi:hypothetical protein